MINHAQPPKNFLMMLFLFAASLFMLISSGFVDSQDGFQYLTIARRMYYDQTFEMPTALFPDGNLHMSLVKGSDEKVYSPTGLGYSLSLIPAVIVEDLFLSAADTPPLAAFPLQNDWPVLLFASMTNAFWGGLLVVGLYRFLMELGVSHKASAVLSLALVVSSNLLPYTKHTFAQLMFATCLLYAFLYIRKSVIGQQKKYMILAGIWFGLVMISYNPTFLFTLPGLGVYYLALQWGKSLRSRIGPFITDILYAGIGVLPFGVLYWWFNSVRFGGVGEAGYSGGVAQGLSFPPIYVIIEGFWGLLLSPGKSIFLHSPLLLLLLIFWFKIPKKIIPELWAGAVTFAVYLWFIGTLLGGPDYLVWHGESSWGPRYLVPTLPVLLVVVGYLITHLKESERRFVVYPLATIGFGIAMLGIVLPYQIRFAGLQTDAFINGRNFNVYEYGNEIPRYAPFFKQSKQTARRLIDLPQLYDRGEYGLKLRDGFGEPYHVGDATWRGVLDRAEIAFTNNPQHIRSLELDVFNYQIVPESSQSARVSVLIDEMEVATATIAANTQETLRFESEAGEVSPFLIHLMSGFESSGSAELKKRQVIFLQDLRVNSSSQNIASIDYPYVSPVSKELYDTNYYYWGEFETDPWSLWHMHSIVFEQTFDFWWIKLRHYWDIPQDFVTALLVTNLAVLSGSGVLVARSLINRP